ncbi:von Willebrand factor C and EGF domain-containing protein [Carlito syrichta]|uniref:von Willebrand factor C and EGF domain-containing protein n=1 Tax=Carlito syrichta TaxID=1868482 RepID=A0A1U7SED0_CARSF|nr:von Willebrand factor C and EGF domain-containing protein [Carlito syrichta]
MSFCASGATAPSGGQEAGHLPRVPREARSFGTGRRPPARRVGPTGPRTWGPGADLLAGWGQAKDRPEAQQVGIPRSSPPRDNTGAPGSTEPGRARGAQAAALSSRGLGLTPSALRRKPTPRPAQGVWAAGETPPPRDPDLCPRPGLRASPRHRRAAQPLRRLGPHVCLSGFGSGCCPGWTPTMGSGHCTLPLCAFGCGSGICIAPNVCSCQDGEQGATCPEAHGPCGEYGCDLTCNHGGCQEVARVCPVGFSMTETAVGIRCTDIDECLSSSCEGHCVNTEGGFVCECGLGMQLSADRHSCQDTDECLGTPCQQRCKNSIGSYKCSCRTGFHLHGNRHSCVDVNECRRPLERRVCHHSCHNTVGSFLCTCRPGFRLRADRVSCEAFPKAILAPSAILQPRQPLPKSLQLLPEAGRPVLSPGHSPPSGAPGPPAGVRTTRLPSPSPPLSTPSPSVPSRLLSTLVATPGLTASLLRTLRPPSLLEGEVVGTPSSPRGPEVPQLTTGRSPCWHLGAMYESGSRWTEPGCAQCWCEDGEVTCEQVRCEAACSHPIPSRDGRCCPSCTGCFHSGVIRAEGDVFSPPNENCTVCVCLAGNVSCISPECPPGPCQATPQSDCCTCVPVRCYFHGRWYADGAMFSGGGDECTTCVCQSGEVECSFTPCPELACPREEWQLGPGQCCFTCREPTPTTGCALDDNGVEFPVGQIWSPGDPCELCVCQADGSVSCKRTDCVDSCPHPIRIPGQCCPDCSAGCTYMGRVFFNNETFPSALDPCLSCICLLGSVACSPVDCPITCTYPFHPDGECCPVCRDCNYEGRKVGNGQVFTLDDEPCTRCTCQLGEVSCEKVPCHQACADPSLLPGDCCSSCSETLSPLEERQGLSPQGDVSFSKATRSPRGDAEIPIHCGSCLGHPTATPQRPMLHLFQLLLRTNLSKAQTLPTNPSGSQAPPSPPLGPVGVSPREPGASPFPQLSPGPLIPLGNHTLPPASQRASQLPLVTPERSLLASGAQTASRWPSLPATHLTEASALSTTDPSPSETSASSGLAHSLLPPPDSL